MSSEPVVLIPVTAEDEARRKRRIWLVVTVAALLVAGAALYIYKRSTDPIKARESYETGVRLYTIGRYAQAVLSFDRATQLQPGFEEAYLMRGRTNFADDRLDAALIDFSKALELRPNDSEALVARGRCSLQLKDYSAAIADAGRAIAIDSRLDKAYNLRGIATREMGNPRGAIDDLNRAVELSPDSENFFERATTYQVLGEHGKALPDLDQMIAIEPDAAPSYFARARSREAIGDTTGAESDRKLGRALDGR
jgi:tetratricopeptide (TPR) repeat protein